MTYSLQSFSSNLIRKKENEFQTPTFVLLSCEKNSIESILKNIRTISIVSDVKQVEGMYDIVIRMDSDSFSKIRNAIVEKIRPIEGVRTCITLQGAKSFNSIQRLWT